MKNLSVFLIGGAGYGLLEILWRGYTHPSMLLAGGVCFLIIWKISIYYRDFSIFKKSLLSAFAITAVEIIIGFIVNVNMHLDVWDYSNLKFNLAGQVSLLYSVLWFFLSGIIIKILEIAEKKQNKKSKI